MQIPLDRRNNRSSRTLSHKQYTFEGSIMPTERGRAPPEYPADKARGGEIILRRKWQRAVFVAGLAGAVVLVLLLQMFALSGS
jgi:hypothetical protein